MNKLFTLLAVTLLCTYTSHGQTFWTENFESGSTSGELVTAYTGPNGTWTQTILSTEGDSPNPWFVSCAENGHTTGVCGTGCVPVTTTATGASLHIGASSPFSGGDAGATYDAGGFCGVLYCVATDRRAESPTINCTGKYTITLSFYYIMDGQPSTDYGTVYYSPDNGATWSLLASPSATPPICPGGQGLWTAYSVALPPSADNNATVKIGFRWVNNDDAIGTDPSIAIDSVSLSTPATTTPVPSFSVAPSYTTCQDSCLNFTNTSTGAVDSFRWSVPGITIATPTVSPASICFSVAGTYTATLTVYHGGAAYPATHTLTVNPTPHPVIHYSGIHTLSVTGAYTGYQWLSGSPIPSAIAGATNSSYTTTTAGTYYVAVDSGGCIGYSLVPFAFTTEGVMGTNLPENTYWIPQNNNGRLTVHSWQPLQQDINVLIYDATGKICSSELWRQDASTLDVNSEAFAPGLYIIKLSNANTATVLRWLK